jgi:hypothetical protein
MFSNEGNILTITCRHFEFILIYIGCSFKFPVKDSLEESIVNAPRITDH